jgi:hypothetical protein
MKKTKPTMSEIIPTMIKKIPQATALPPTTSRGASSKPPTIAHLFNTPIIPIQITANPIPKNRPTSKYHQFHNIIEETIEMKIKNIKMNPTILLPFMFIDIATHSYSIHNLFDLS